MKRQQIHSVRPHVFLSVTIAFLIGVALYCTGCGSTPTTSTISYDQHPGRIVVQLFRAPGFIYPNFNGVPEWTLYGDGTLIYLPKGVGKVLLETKLSSAEVQHILDVVVNQNAFFSSSHATYGRVIPDVGSDSLLVNANGQSKAVNLLGKPQNLSDTETTHVFDIRDFLLSYQPQSPQVYVPTGIALLAIDFPHAQGYVATWPYKDISLTQTAAQECPLLSSASTCPTGASNAGGVIPVYGQPGQQLLSQARSSAYMTFSQNGKAYRVIVWPLLPDALTPQADGTQAVTVKGAHAGKWPLLAGYGHPGA